MADTGLMAGLSGANFLPIPPQMAQAGISGYFHVCCAEAYHWGEIIRFDISLAAKQTE